MAKYTGEVRTNTDDDFLFIAIVVDENGKLVSDLPVRTRRTARRRSPRL